LTTRVSSPRASACVLLIDTEAPMTTPEKMRRKQEYEFYAQAENQTPKGPARRREQNLTELVLVRFDVDLLDEVRRRAGADDRSVAAWIRRAVEQALHD
jgi:uncharacterized protein (DUF4415 family)